MERSSRKKDISTMINYNVDADGIATITWDMPGRTMNVLNEASITAYAGALEQALKDDKVKGIILTSGKADFIAGADLEMLLGADTSDAGKLMDQFGQLQKLFRRQETCGKPSWPRSTAWRWAAASRSAWPATTASPRPIRKAKVGLPEVKVGLLPGAGGTQRLPRLIGVMNAAPILLEGKDLTVDAAKGLGLIHEVVPADELLARAKAWLMAPAAEQVVPEYAGKGAKPIDGRAVQPGTTRASRSRLPGGQVWSPPACRPSSAATPCSRQDLRQLSGAARHHVAASTKACRCRSTRRCKVETRYFVVAAARSRGQEHDPHAVLRPAGGQQAGAPAQGRAEVGVQEGRRAGRRHDGRGHRQCVGQAGIEMVLIDATRTRPTRARRYRRRARQAGEARPADAGEGATRCWP